MKVGEIFAYCAGCDVSLLVGMKLNEFPCPEHAECYEFYCDAYVRDAESRLKARKPT
jgi:predicted RNA-binding Zn-ribbon protein involved in translation (DUF1610 family)